MSEMSALGARMVKALEQANQPPPPPPEEADAVYHKVYTNDGVDITIVKTSPQDSSRGSKGKGPEKSRPSAWGPPPPPPPMMHGALAGEAEECRLHLHKRELRQGTQTQAIAVQASTIEGR